MECLEMFSRDNNHPFCDVWGNEIEGDFKAKDDVTINC